MVETLAGTVLMFVGLPELKSLPWSQTLGLFA